MNWKLASRQALRRTRRNPAFALAASATLALALGGGAAVLALAWALLFAPLPYATPGALVVLDETRPRHGVTPVAPADFVDWRRDARSFAGIAAWRTAERTLAGPGEPRSVEVLLASPEFLDVLRPAIAPGAAWTAGEPRSAVLSRRLWREAFDASASVIGSVVRLGDEPVRVAGVLSSDLPFPPGDVWLPARGPVPELETPLGLDVASMRDARFLGVVGRLREGVDVAAADAELQAIAARLRADHPRTNAGVGARVIPLAEDLHGGRRPALFALGAIALALWLVASANVALLLVARAAAARREAAVSRALGASDAAALAPLRLEVIAVAAAGAAGAMGVAPLAVRFAAPWLRLADGVELPWGAAAAASLGLAAVTALALARLATRSAGGDLALLLRGRTAGANPGARTLRHALVAAQVAAGLALAAGAGLATRGVSALERTAQGFEAGAAAAFEVALPDPRQATPAAARALAAELVAAAAAAPGVTAAGGGNRLPLTGSGASAGLVVEGRTYPPNQAPNAAWRAVDPGYFAAMGIALQRGRTFDRGDGWGAPRVGIVNQALARQVFPGEDPVGRRLRTGLDGHDDWVTVVGVVADTPHERPGVAPPPELYRPLAQEHRMALTRLHVVVRASSPAAVAAVAAAARDAVRRAAPRLAVRAPRPLGELGQRALARHARAADVLSLGAGLAVALAGLGLFGLLSALGRERAAEFALRLALGGRPHDVARLLVGETTRVVALGLVPGALAGLALLRGLQAALPGLPGPGPLEALLAAALVVAPAAVAAALPAWRAARTPAADVLREG
jgi:putative ABC transport system permease protein